MKKAFTLIEILITLLLIALVLTMVSRMGRGFSDRIRFASTKEEVISKMTNVIQEAATTNSVAVGTGQQKYGTITMTLPISGNVISWSYASGDLTQTVSGESIISYGTVASTGYSIVLKPYAVGCDTAAGGTFTVVSADDPKLKACYETNAATCKIREVKCNP